MLTRRAHRSEHGFTLIELVVGMVLLVLVITAIVAAISGLGSASSDTMANRASQQQALDALETMRRDIRVARTPARDAWDGRRDTLRQLLYFESDQAQPGAADASRAVCNGIAYVHCMRDVTVATPNQFWFRADVRQGSGWIGAECVGYTASSTALTRTVSPNWRACGPGVAGGVQDAILRGRLDAAPFSYTLRAHPNIPANGIAPPSECRTSTTPNVSGRNLNFITAVQVGLTSVFSERQESATNGVDTSLVITGRTSGDHAYAVGCSH